MEEADYKKLFELKQNDWIEACKEIDVLNSALKTAYWKFIYKEPGPCPTFETFLERVKQHSKQ